MTIPKVFHFVWKGDALPVRYAEWRDAWLAMHPGWACIEWGVGSAPEAPANVCHVRQWSNWVRLKKLLEFGGVYMDFDTQPLKNIEPLLEGCSAAASPFRFQYANRPNRCCNSFLAAEPSHPWISECCQMLELVDPAEHLSMGSSLITQALQGRDDVKILNVNDIWQMPHWNLLGRKPDSRWYAIHHFDNMARKP